MDGNSALTNGRRSVQSDSDVIGRRREKRATDVYLDNNATTFPLPEVRAALLDVLESPLGNPSSAHSCGSRTRERIRSSREAVARLIGAEPDQVIFTSGATEANNTILSSSVARLGRGARVVTSAVEHSSVLKVCESLGPKGVEVVYLPVDEEGLAQLSDLRSAIGDRTALVSVQWVNNETGVIQPVEAMGKVCREHGVPFHTDAAQAVGKIETDFDGMPLAYASVAGHKLHAPKGIGALWARDPRSVEPLLHGGDQEDSRRAGTENILGIVGFGVAASLRQQRFATVSKRIRRMRDEFESRVLNEIAGVRINGSLSERVGNCTNMLFDGVDGEALVARLDQEGICCSQSSACTSHRPEPSYVLRAMGLSEEEAYSSVRFSFSELNTIEEVGIVVAALKKLCSVLRTVGTRSRRAV